MATGRAWLEALAATVARSLQTPSPTALPPCTPAAVRAAEAEGASTPSPLLIRGRMMAPATSSMAIASLA
eukprot:8296251-Alexandrium_andersonii.AAC.1